MNRLYTSKPRSLKSAKEFAAMLNAALTKGAAMRKAGPAALRFIAVVVAAPAAGYHVCTLGFAVANELEVIR